MCVSPVWQEKDSLMLEKVMESRVNEATLSGKLACEQEKVTLAQSNCNVFFTMVDTYLSANLKDKTKNFKRGKPGSGGSGGSGGASSSS